MIVTRPERRRALVSALAACIVFSAGFARAEPADAGSPTDVPSTLDQLVAEAALNSGLPASWIAAVVRIESGGKVRAVSPKGAMGLMQLMPGTWSALRVRYRLGPDPFDPGDNLRAGAAYLRELYDRYGPSGFLAAYNAGPGRYEQAAHFVQALPRETVAYVARLQPTISRATTAKPVESALRPVSWRSSGLFAERPSSVSALTTPPPHQSPRDTTRNALRPAAQGLFVTAGQ